jgi:butyrate kinase
LLILAINPGSTSTKVALYSNDELVESETIDHPIEVIKEYKELIDQLPYRLELVEQFIKDMNISESLSAVVGRGGMLKSLPSGTYEVNDKMQNHLEVGISGIHASNLGGLIAKRIAEKHNCKAMVVDPVAVDEMQEEARISGLPQIERKSMSHALNIKAVCHRYANEQVVDLKNLKLIIAHLGGGISIAPILDGRIIDVNNANEMGPFSPERAGTVPSGDLVKLCFSRKYKSAKEVKNLLNRESGLVGYLGTNDLRVVEKKIENGDEKAKLIWEAMCYQIVKEIGAMAAVLNGKVDAILLTGGLAYSQKLVEYIREKTAFIAKTVVFAGEDELRALAEGAYRVLIGREQLKEYIY